MGNFYGHLHSREAMTNGKPLAAAAGRRPGRGRHRHRRRGQARRRRGLWRHLSVQRHRPPARSARHHNRLRSGDLGGPARPRPRAAAQSARRGGRRHAASRRHARGTGRNDRACRRSGSARSSANTTRPSTKAPCTSSRRRGAATAPRRGRSGRRRSMPCRSARRSPTPWAASWWTARPACSTPPASRSRGCSPRARPSAGSMAVPTPATSAG